MRDYFSSHPGKDFFSRLIFHQTTATSSRRVVAISTNFLSVLLIHAPSKLQFFMSTRFFLNTLSLFHVISLYFVNFFQQFARVFKNVLTIFVNFTQNPFSIIKYCMIFDKYVVSM